MGEALTGINGNIIRWARCRCNLSIEDAAKAIGIDVTKYSDIENGNEFPTYAKLKKIGEVFHKPTAIFFFSEPPSLPSIEGDLRTLSSDIVSGLSRNIIIQMEKAKAYQIHLHDLYGERKSFLCDREKFPTDITELSNFIRSAIAFPVSAQKARKNPKIVFEYFRNVLYDLGIYVFKDSFKDNSISGFCINDDQYPIIVINNSMSFARQNFTLFHELYHLIINTSGIEIIRDDYLELLEPKNQSYEKACDMFANEFLVPTSDFNKELSKYELDDKRIAELAKLYSVSKEAIMYKLYSMNIISPDEYNDLKEFFYGDALRNNKDVKKENSGGGNYYFTKLSYLGTRYTSDVFKQYFSGNIDSFKASEMLGSKVDHLPNLETAFYRGIR